MPPDVPTSGPGSIASTNGVIASGVAASLPSPTVSTAPYVLPYVHYLPDKFATGANTLANAVSSLSGDFETVFKTYHTTDAHFVTYQIPGEPTIPRLNKPVLHHIRAHGGDITATMFVFDWDTDGHLPMENVTWWKMFTQLEDVAREWAPAMQFNLLYTTRNGIRLLYLLDQKLPVDKAEGMHRWMVQQFGHRGIILDPLSDWTRLFRLPYVTRDKRPTWLDDAPPVQVIWNGYTPFPVAELGTAGDSRGRVYGEIIPVTSPKPAPDVCDKLLYIVKSATGTHVPSAFYKHAKKSLKGRECYPCLFEFSALAPAGRRDDTIHRYVGQAVGILHSFEGCKPDHIYALFLDAVQQLTPDANTRDWTEVLWSAVARLWAKEEAKIKTQEIKEEDKAIQMSHLAASITEGMRLWCPAAELRNSHQSLDYVNRHLIASVGSTYFLMGPDGWYDPTPLLMPQVIAAIRARGLDTLIPTRQPNAEGAYVDRSAASVINEHATVVSELWAAPAPGGAFISNVDTPQAQVTLPAFWRNETLKPEFNTWVDIWLQKLAGDHYAKLLLWIGYALAFDEGPICALSIRGPAGSGKKMLVRGLSECLKLPRVATSDDLVGDCNYGLLQSPFLSIDEGWVKPGKGRHPADQFRSIVAGDTFVIKRKFMAPTNITNCARVIFTSNNLDVIKVLTHRRELSPDDREALSQRLLHMDITKEASNWLNEKGGVRFTGATGERWIMGDGGEESDFVVAKHFLWLYEKRAELGAVGKRFLVEGNAADEIMLELRTGAGASPLVVECIIKMLEKRTVWDGMAVVDDRLFVSAGEVLSYFRANMREANHATLTADMINNAFVGISVTGREVKPFILRTREQVGARKWHEIDCKILLEVAMRDAWKCDTLRELVLRQEGVAGKIAPWLQKASVEALGNGAGVGKGVG